MPLPPPFLCLLAAALPVSPGVFMAIIVLSACAYGAVIIFNYQSLKYKSTHRLCVISVMLLVAGLLVAEASIGLTFDGDSPPLLKTIPGQLAMLVLVLAAGSALGGCIHCYLHRHRFRRGRKRALGAFVLSIVAIGALYHASNASRNPDVRPPAKPRVALLPETDDYGRPLATPEPATPVPATPRPATPPPVATPIPIATPEPSRLLPSVITPS
jgi:hypothetical protein